MKALLSASVGVIASVALLSPSFADEPGKLRKRAPAARPAAAAPAPAPQQTANWTGGQLGSSNGVSTSSNNFVEPGSYNCFGLIFIGNCPETPFSFDNNKSSFASGVYAGYRVQFGMWVVGIEGDVYYKRGSSSGALSNPPPWLLQENFNGSMRQGWDGSVRGRIGWLVTPAILAYGTGGVAIAEVDGSFSYNSCSVALLGLSPVCVRGSDSWSDTRVGWTAGGGVEVALFAGWKARVEYRYSDLGRYSHNVPLSNNSGGVCPSSVCGTNARIDMHPTEQKVTFGIGFDFF